MMPRISVLLRDSQTIKLFACQLYRSCSNHALFSSDMAAATHAANKLMMKQTRQKLPKLQGKLLIVEGNIAAGKSTFSQRLGKHFDYVVRIAQFLPPKPSETRCKILSILGLPLLLYSGAGGKLRAKR